MKDFPICRKRSHALIEFFKEKLSTCDDKNAFLNEMFSFIKSQTTSQISFNSLFVKYLSLKFNNEITLNVQNADFTDKSCFNLLPRNTQSNKHYLFKPTLRGSRMTDIALLLRLCKNACFSLFLNFLLDILLDNAKNCQNFEILKVQISMSENANFIKFIRQL